MYKNLDFIRHEKIVFAIVIFMLAFTASACSSIIPNRRDEGHEESGAELSLDQAYDRIRGGARLVLVYDEQSNSFHGHVENITDGILEQVRVEVHLSNGIELGPTTPVDLDPGEKIGITLAATTSSFDGWTAHPEVGGGETGEHGLGEGEGEHQGEGEGEHDREGGGEHEEEGSD